MMEASLRQRPNPLDLETIANTTEEISVVPLFAGEELAKDRAQLLDLSCCGLVHFVPDLLYVRDEMQQVLKSVTSKEPQKTLVVIGSPGVGKSVVFFLAALNLAAIQKKRVIYVRWVESEEEKPTIFLIEPTTNKAGHCNLGQFSFFKFQYTLDDVARAAVDYGYQTNSNWRFMLDGPKESTVKSLSGMFFDLCTSGGYKTPADGARMTTKLKIMTGWTEDSFVHALIHLKKLTAKQARDVYAECGGRLRLALDYLDDGTAVKNWADNVVADLGSAPCILAMNETNARTSVESKDRLRTMFEGTNGRPVQLVDSQYLLTRLRDRLTTDDLRQAYKVALALGSRTIMGVLFEEIMHKWFQMARPSPLVGFVRSERGKTGRERVGDLTEPLIYWVPSTPNFANIDAAFIDANEGLHCIQYTIKDSHSFHEYTFEADLIAELKEKFPNGFKSAAIYFAVPTGVNFNLQDHSAFECDEETTTCQFQVVYLNFDADEEIQSSATTFFPFLDSPKLS
jgi:hypothetical protein